MGAETKGKQTLPRFARQLIVRKDGTALVIGAVPPNLKLLPSNRKHLILLDLPHI